MMINDIAKLQRKMWWYRLMLGLLMPMFCITHLAMIDSYLPLQFLMCLIVIVMVFAVIGIMITKGKIETLDGEVQRAFDDELVKLNKGKAAQFGLAAFLFSSVVLFLFSFENLSSKDTALIIMTLGATVSSISFAVLERENA